MSPWTEVIRTVLPVFLIIGIGVLCRSKGLISREGIDTLKRVAVNICLPAVLFKAFAVTEYGPADILIPLAMFAVCVLAWGLGRAGARVFRLKSRFVPFLTTGFEAGMLGYALYAMLYPGRSAAPFARIDLGQVLFVFTLYKLLLGTGGGERADRRKLVRDMVTSPIILAILAGVLAGATGLYRLLEPSGVSAVITACADLIAAPTSVLILLAIGYDLVLRDIPWRVTLQAAALRFGIMAVLWLLFRLGLRALSLEAEMGSALTLMFLLPPPFVLPVFADDADQRVFVSSVLSVSTLAAIAGFCVLAVIAGGG